MINGCDGATGRSVVGILSAATFADLTAQAEPALRAADLQGCLTIQRRTLPGEDVAIVQRALHRSLEQFHAVRDLDLDDTVAPVLIFDVVKP